MNWQNKFSPLRLNENDALPELALISLPSWKAITVTGEDKKSYLQGQLTCDIVTLAETDSTLGAHCDAKGKVWSLFRLFSHNEGYALFQHASGIDKALAEIKKYSVFSKVEISISQENAFGLAGKKAEDYINSISDGSGNVRSCRYGTAVKIDQQRWLLLADDAQSESLTDSFDKAMATEELWDLLDIKAAIPRITDQQQNEHIPQALNLHLIGGISFSKGCYTGQETVARAKYRGTNKRAMYLLSGKSEAEISPSSELERGVGPNWRTAGEFITTYRFTDGTVYGLIVLPNNLESDTKFRLAHEAESGFSFAEMPYSLEGEQ